MDDIASRNVDKACGKMNLWKATATVTKRTEDHKILCSGALYTAPSATLANLTTPSLYKELPTWDLKIQQRHFGVNLSFISKPVHATAGKKY